MACLSFSLLVLFSVVTLFSCSSFATSDTIKVTNDQVKQVCSHTTDSKLCIQILMSDHRTSQANMTGLAGISLDLATSSTNKTFKLLKRLVKQAPAGPVKHRYETCLNEYNNAVYALGLAWWELDSKDYQRFYNQASTAFNEVENCDDEFKVPPVDPTPLRGLNKKNAFLASINMAITKFLH